jgi:hypothetical protein
VKAASDGANGAVLQATIPYLGDDLLLLEETLRLARDAGLTAPLLFRASEVDKLPRIFTYGTDRGGYPGARPFRGAEDGSVLHEDVVLATTADDIQRGAAEPEYSTSFKKLPGITEPLVLLYDRRAFEAVGEKEYRFSSPRNKSAALLAVLRVEHVPMPAGWFSPQAGLSYRALVERALAPPTTEARTVCGRIVEVGVWRGRSTSYVARLVSARGGTLECVDAWEGSSDEFDAAYRRELAREDVEAAFRRHLTRLGAPALVRRERSLAAAAACAPGSVDLVFLDASHDRAAVEADLEAWFHALRPGGTLAGHDYTPKHAGVLEAVRAFTGRRGLAAQEWPGGVFAVTRP